MYWADKIAIELKKRNLPIEWVDDMKTPSGRVHVGALIGVAVHGLIFESLKKFGVNSKYTYVFENHDPMDDIPSYLPREKFEPYLGMPLYKVPSPEKGFSNYAEFYALEFKKVFNAIGFFPEIIWTKDLYTSGKMNPGIKLVLNNAQEIRNIYQELYNKVVPDDWFPFQVYCEKCGKVSTTKVNNWDGEKVSYKCANDAVKWTNGCGYKGKISPYSTTYNFAGKLPWKVEWSAKWQAIGVTIEGAGKDHMSSGGSHDLTSLVAKKVLKYPVPYPIPYEWMLIGGKKMSSSKGVGFAAGDMLEILPPTLLRFLLVKMNIKQQMNFDPTDPETIPKLFDEYQKAASEYEGNGENTDLGRIFKLSQIENVIYPPKIRFQHLTQWVQMPNMDDEIMKAGITEWVPYAKIWVERFAPEHMKFTIQKEIPPKASELNELQKEYLIKIVSELDKPWDAEEFQKKLYEWAKEIGISSAEAFSALYIPLLGKNYGPKAAWLILKEDKEFIKNRYTEISSINQDKTNTAINFLNRPDIFRINSSLSRNFPSVSIGIATIKNVHINKIDDSLEKEKRKLLNTLHGLTTEQLSQYPEIQSYRKLYKITGVDWHSRRPSPEALLRRIALSKGLYTVNTCVDAYNLIVMKSRVSVGAFDLDKINFPTELRFAKNKEEILLLGEITPTKYKEGEIAYFDRYGGYNLDFNYRDAQRTAVNDNTKNLLINVDGIYEITPEKVEKVLKETCDIITKYCGGKVDVFGVETT